MKRKIEKVETLLEALPYIKKFRDEKIVVKYGGSAQESDELKAKFAQDIVMLHTIGLKPIIVHGGGKDITSFLKKMGIESRFIDGQRVTTKEAMRVVEMVLSGRVNREIVALLNSQGAKAIGISGKDGSFIKAVPKDIEKFGYTGVISSIDSEVIDNI